MSERDDYLRLISESNRQQARREFQRTGLTYNGGEGPRLPVCQICFALMPEGGPERHIQWHADRGDA